MKEEEKKHFKYFEEELIQFKKRKICKRCLNILKPKKGRFNIVRCSRKNCRYECSLFESSIFKDVRISWETIIDVIYMWFNGVRNGLIAKILYISRKSITNIINNVSKIIKNNKNLFCVPIGGEDMIVEVDESKLGKNI